MLLGSSIEEWIAFGASSSLYGVYVRHVPWMKHVLEPSTMSMGVCAINASHKGKKRKKEEKKERKKTEGVVVCTLKNLPH